MEEYVQNLKKEFKAQIELSVSIGIQEGVKKILSEIKTKSQPKYMSKCEAAKFLGISLVTLHSYVKSGIINSYRLGGSVKFLQSDLEAALTLRKFS